MTQGMLLCSCVRVRMWVGVGVRAATHLVQSLRNECLLEHSLSYLVLR